jgi:hypothetical protein
MAWPVCSAAVYCLRKAAYRSWGTKYLPPPASFLPRNDITLYATPGGSA